MIEVQARPDPIDPEQHHADKPRFQKERRQHLIGEEWPDHPTVKANCGRDMTMASGLIGQAPPRAAARRETCE